MIKMPLELKKDLIIEAVFEVRFIPAVPSDAVFGLVYPIVKKHFPGVQEKQLPIMQIPAIARAADPNLKFQPTNRLQDGNKGINIGPNVISFSIQKPYSGWRNWKPSIKEILKKIAEQDVFSAVERTGLRYINFFEGDAFPYLNIELKVIDNSVNRVSTSIRTEICEGEYIKILQVLNNATLSRDKETITGSLVDIDIAKFPHNKSSNDFKINLDTIITKSHKLAKELFFSVLKPEFLDNLEPVYAEAS